MQVCWSKRRYASVCTSILIQMCNMWKSTHPRQWGISTQRRSHIKTMKHILLLLLKDTWTHSGLYIWQTIWWVFLLHKSNMVWYQWLFVKLYELGFKGKMWRIILTMYTNISSCVAFGAQSHLACWSVRQGGYFTLFHWSRIQSEAVLFGSQSDWCIITQKY